MGVEESGKFQVSEAAEELDNPMDDFCSRPLDQGRYNFNDLMH